LRFNYAKEGIEHNLPVVFRVDTGKKYNRFSFIKDMSKSPANRILKVIKCMRKNNFLGTKGKNFELNFLK
jgi:hypothetical protein